MDSLKLKYVRKDQDIIITPKDKPHTETIIFLHGLGDTADGWFSLFYSKQSPVRDTTKVVLLTAPKAPVSINFGMTTTSWYDIKSISIDESTFTKTHGLEEIKTNTKRVVTVLENEIKELNGDSKKVFIGGFSQGCCLALYAGLSFNQTLGGIVGLSGYFFPITEINKANEMTPILLTHGLDDPLIPYEASQLSYKKIMGGERKIRTLWVPQLEHGINEKVIKEFKTFFNSCFDEK